MVAVAVVDTLEIIIQAVAQAEQVVVALGQLVVILGRAIILQELLTLVAVQVVVQVYLQAMTLD
jgi:hypothetical protein